MEAVIPEINFNGLKDWMDYNPLQSPVMFGWYRFFFFLSALHGAFIECSTHTHTHTHTHTYTHTNTHAHTHTHTGAPTVANLWRGHLWHFVQREGKTDRQR